MTLTRLRLADADKNPRIRESRCAADTNPFGIDPNSCGVVANHFVVVTNCFAVEKAVILEMFYPESYFLKYEILNQVQDDECTKAR
ncbi:hypothetical protein [Kosmotoga sp. DU53]|uniref:hypothetical protein n=1 Tax=Kosmotoga sp. DU53 TaxID=1310160 RepID=UPI0007C54A58|nr:hypothetical protein [Kosmotoga sp. DU53]OAA20838.1 hypothetical protein DU53_07000 [Kosmotoga sp. DU53]